MIPWPAVEIVKSVWPASSWKTAMDGFARNNGRINGRNLILAMLIPILCYARKV